MFHLYQVSQLTTLMPPSTENRLALSAYSSPRWVACKKHVFAKQTSLQLRSGAGNSARTVPGRDSKYLAGPSQSALGRLQKNTFLQNKRPYDRAAGRTDRIFAAHLGEPSDRGSAALYVGRMTRSHRSFPADF